MRNAKRVISILLAIVLIAFCAVLSINIFALNNKTNNSSQINVSAWAGSGTSADPYLIKTIDDMNTLANNSKFYNAHFKLVADLDYEGEEFTPIGQYGGGREFKGTFDGGGHTISKAKIVINNVASGLRYGVGIFGCVSSATIKNLKSENMEVEFSGENKTNEIFAVGGIVGIGYNGTILNCETEKLYVHSYETKFTSGLVCIAGIVGFCQDTRFEISNCKASLELSDFTYVNASSDDPNLTVYQSGILNTNLSSSGYYSISYCCASRGGVNNNYSNVTAIVRAFCNLYPYKECENSSYNEILADNGTPWIDNKVVEEWPLTIESSHSCFSIDKKVGYKNLGTSPVWGKDGSVWFYDTNYSSEPYLRLFKDWYTYYFITAYSKNGQTIETKSAGGVNPPRLENVPSGSAWVENTTKSTTTILNQSISYMEKEGYKFSHWKKADDDYSDLDVTIQAVLTLTDYTITYDYVGGTATNIETYDVETEYTLDNPIKLGYDFLGWTGSNGETAQTSVTIPKGSTGNKSYTANWKPTKYTITYNLNGGNLQSGQTNPTEYYITTSTFTLNNPTRPGYIFAGWSGSGLSGTANKKVTISQGLTGNRSYAANWVEDVYTITYNLNGGTQETIYRTSYKIFDTPFILNYSPTRSGYNFLGWTGSNGAIAQKSITVTSGTTGNLTYNAQWEVITYTISYELKGGAMPEGQTNPTTYNVETPTFMLKNPIRTGYNFLGWTGSNGNTPKIEVKIDRGSTGNRTYTAKWEIIRFNINIMTCQNGETPKLDKTIIADYGNKFSYSANLSMTNDSKFNWAYKSVQNQSLQDDEYKQEGVFLEYYKVTANGTVDEDYTDGATISNKEIFIYSDVVVELGFVGFYTVTFEENKLGVKSFENKNSYTNPINLRSGSKIIGSYDGYPNRELNYTITYNNGKADITQDIAKYSIEQYYRVTDTKNVDNLNADTTISPTIEFYACLVTMGGIDSNIGTRSITGDNYNTSNDGIFVVEFGTVVTFKLDAGTEGLFKYTYTFKYGETTVATIVYTITNDDYAMQYVLDGVTGERKNILNGLHGNQGTFNTDSYEFPGPSENKSPTSEMTSKTISPTFGKKQYAGGLA